MKNISLYARITTNLNSNVTTTSRHLLPTRRSFFASSTDHTTLLSNAKVHCLTQEDGDSNGQRQYILLPQDISLDLAKKVDKLHLARLYAKNNVIYGAKVIQRTLGTESDVCMPLLHAALDDISSKGGEKAIALASLDGLCRWVSSVLDGHEQETVGHATNERGDKKLHSLLGQWRVHDQAMYEATKAIATGVPRPGHSVVGQGTYRDGGEGWMQIAELFVERGMSAEGLLYEKGGGELQNIDHLADTSREGLKYAGGSMARFIFR